MNQLYTDAMLEHSKHPRNFLKEGIREPGWFPVAGKFPSCSENMIIYFKHEDETIIDVKWFGSGSSVMMAAGSIGTQHIKGMTFNNAFAWADNVFSCFSKVTNFSEDLIGDMILLEPVKDYPRRVKSAILTAHTVKLAITKMRQQNGRR